MSGRSSIFLFMSETTERLIGVVVTLPIASHAKLKAIAQANKRSLTRHAEWVLEQHIKAQEDDGA